MSLLSGLFGGGSTKFKPVPYNDPFTPQYLQGIDASGQGARKRINDSYDANAGTLFGQLQSRGLGSSTLAGSYTLANEDRRQQALLDLENQLYSQRLGAMQSGTNSALQQLGIYQTAKTANRGQNIQQAGNNSSLFAGGLQSGATLAASGAPFMGFI